MHIDGQELWRAVNGALPFNLRTLRDMAGLQSLTFRPREGSALHDPRGQAAPTVALPADSVLAPAALMHHAWQPEELMFAQRVATAHGALDLVDVGANVGLYARQVCLHVPFNVLHAYEPDPDNFALLQRNLQGLPNVRLHNVALAEAAGEATFYKEEANSGNASLVADAMAGSPHAVGVVQRRDIRAEAVTWLASGRPLFYKSDTQGYDELLATTLDLAFWQRVAGAILEVWRIPKPQADRAALAALLDRFEHRAFLDAPDTRLTTAEILAYMHGDDRHFNDLALW